MLGDCVFPLTPKRRPSLGPIAAVQDLADIRGVLQVSYALTAEDSLRRPLLYPRHFFIKKVRDYEDRVLPFSGA